MSEIITRTDMTRQVQEVVDSCEGEYDVAAIVDEIHAAHGLIDINGLGHDEFWAVVLRHAK